MKFITRSEINEIKWLTRVDPTTYAKSLGLLDAKEQELKAQLKQADALEAHWRERRRGRKAS